MKRGVRALPASMRFYRYYRPHGLDPRVLLIAILRYFSSNMVARALHCTHNKRAKTCVCPYMNAFSTSQRSASNRKVYRRTHEANGKVELSLLAYYRMAFQSKDVLCEDFSRAFNRQMNSKRQVAFRNIAIGRCNFHERFRKTRSLVWDFHFVSFLVEFISDKVYCNRLKNCKRFVFLFSKYIYKEIIVLPVFFAVKYERD